MARYWAPICRAQGHKDCGPVWNPHTDVHVADGGFEYIITDVVCRGVNARSNKLTARTTVWPDEATATTTAQLQKSVSENAHKREMTTYGVSPS